MKNFSSIRYFHSRYLATPEGNRWTFKPIKSLVLEYLKLVADLFNSTALNIHPHHLPAFEGYSKMPVQTENIISAFYVVQAFAESIDEKMVYVEFLFQAFGKKYSDLMWTTFILMTEKSMILPFPIRFM